MPGVSAMCFHNKGSGLGLLEIHDSRILARERMDGGVDDTLRLLQHSLLLQP